MNSVFSTQIGCRWLAYAKNRGTRPRAFTQTFTPCDATVSAFARCQAPGSPGSHSMPAIALTGSVEITRRARASALVGAGHDGAVAACATRLTVAPSRISPATSAAIAWVNPLMPPTTR